LLLAKLNIIFLNLYDAINKFVILVINVQVIANFPFLVYGDVVNFKVELISNGIIISTKTKSQVFGKSLQRWLNLDSLSAWKALLKSFPF